MWGNSFFIFSFSGKVFSYFDMYKYSNRGIILIKYESNTDSQELTPDEFFIMFRLIPVYMVTVIIIINDDISKLVIFFINFLQSVSFSGNCKIGIYGNFHVFECVF